MNVELISDCFQYLPDTYQLSSALVHLLLVLRLIRNHYGKCQGSNKIFSVEWRSFGYCNVSWCSQRQEIWILSLWRPFGEPNNFRSTLHDKERIDQGNIEHQEEKNMWIPSGHALAWKVFNATIEGIDTHFFVIIIVDYTWFLVVSAEVYFRM